MTTHPRHQLLGAEVSLYTGKVRAYLRFKGIDFDEVADRWKLLACRSIVPVRRIDR